MRPLALLLVVLLLAGCANPPERPADDVSEQTVSLEPDSFYVGQFDMPYNARVRIAVEVLEGGPVDVWLGYGATCGEWLTAGFQPVETAFSVNNTTIETALPVGEACLPIDNTDYGSGTANSGAPARVHYRIELFRRE